MNLKSLLLTISASAMALGAAAQQHHGFFYQPTMQDFRDFYDTPASATSDEINAINYCLNPWFTDNLVMPMLKADGSLEASTIYENNKTDLIPRKSKIDNSNADKVTGAIVQPVMENGYMVVTIPGKLDYPFETDYTQPGVMLFHCVLGSKSDVHRVNDAENSLSATGNRAYLKDCTGVYLGIKAPAGCTVKAYLSTPNISRKNLGTYMSYNSNVDDKMGTIAFDFEGTTNGQYVEMTSGQPYNHLAGIEMTTTHNAKWPDGYCVKFIDVAVYGVKAGDKVGFGGIQSLHDGWTPKEFVPGWAGVETIGVDTNANAPVEYFNIQGMRVAADNLTPGLYIRRQGTDTTKVLVK